MHDDENFLDGIIEPPVRDSECACPVIASICDTTSSSRRQEPSPDQLISAATSGEP
jgi:hypothetical protein